MRSMDSISKTTCSDKTSATDRVTVITGLRSNGRPVRPTNRIGGSYTRPGLPVTVSPHSTGAPQTEATNDTPRRAGAKPRLGLLAQTALAIVPVLGNSALLWANVGLHWSGSP